MVRGILWEMVAIVRRTPLPHASSGFSKTLEMFPLGQCSSFVHNLWESSGIFFLKKTELTSTESEIDQ